jgi:hypothetical protein
MGVENILELEQFGLWGLLAIVVYFLAKSEITIKYPRGNKSPSTPDEEDK